MAIRKKTKSKNGFSDLWKLNRKKRTILGSLLILISVYLFIACFSYIFTWQVDQDKLMPFNISMLWEGDLHISNWLGRLGGITSHGLIYWGFGLGSFFIIYLFLKMGIMTLRKSSFVGFGRHIFYVVLMTSFISITLGFFLQSYSFSFGGNFGITTAIWLSNFIGEIGLFLLLFAITIVYLFWVFKPNLEDFSLGKLSSVLADKNVILENFKISKETSDNNSNISNKSNKGATSPPPTPSERVTKETTSEDDNDYSVLKPRKNVTIEELDHELTINENINGLELETEVPEKEEVPLSEKSEIEIVENATIGNDMAITIDDGEDEEKPFDPTLELSRYTYPDIGILQDYTDQKKKVDRLELEEKKNEIIRTLSNYKIEITKIMATVGPTVTLYEIVPAPGIRISRIKNLEDDIALSLSALGIRIIAPIPGKGTIGIEVPNKHKQIVSLKEVLLSEKFQTTKMELPIALGKTISNEVFIADLVKMPHLLIAGATGQGKSVGINTIIMSILYKKHPSQVKIVMVDPKKVELFPYAKLENHFLAYLPDSDEPITTDVTKAVHTLNSLCIEMDQRYDLLKKASARNIKEYNQKFVNRRLNPTKGHKYLPYIVLIVDEFADLMMTAGKEVEHPIARLAQLARAVGIHLIIATQRPSVNIITGSIKANFLARVAFKVTSKVDSRTILDTGGADQLIGRGDMLLSVGSKIVRIQGAFIDTPEVEEVINFIFNQPCYPEPHFLPEFKDENDAIDDDPLSITVDDLDDYFEDAAKLVFQTQSGSTSMLQRKMRLGYNRAGRIMDQLEHFGIVGPPNGSKPRELIVYSEDELDNIIENIKEQQESY